MRLHRVARCGASLLRKMARISTKVRNPVSQAESVRPRSPMAHTSGNQQGRHTGIANRRGVHRGRAFHSFLGAGTNLSASARRHQIEYRWPLPGRSGLAAHIGGQAEAAARQLAHVAPMIDAMFSSPLGRTRKTADILRSLATYPPVQWDSRLQEVSVGSWGGLTHIDIDACWPGLLDGASPFDWFFRSPEGESYDAAVERVGNWLTGLGGIMIAAPHGLLGRIIRSVYLGLPKDQTLQLPVMQDIIWPLRSGKNRCPDGGGGVIERTIAEDIRAVAPSIT